MKDKGFRDLETCLAFVGQRDFSVQVLLLSFRLLVSVLFLSAIGGVPPLLSQAGYSSALVSLEQKLFLWSGEALKSRQEISQGEWDRSF